jgi:16S rRNA (guanine966-N2)-methyltransferase
MRIVGGAHRGLALAAPGPGKGGIRPTADRVRESLFNLLEHGGYGDPVAGARVLDLFAGTGGLGLEALSRGAAAAVFVDEGREALGLLRENVARIGAGARARVLARNATRLGANPEAGFDLVFLDPPYGRGLGARAVAAAAAGGWLAPGALVVLEERVGEAAPGGLTLIDARRYGDTMISIARAP